MSYRALLRVYALMNSPIVARASFMMVYNCRQPCTGVHTVCVAVTNQGHSHFDNHDCDKLLFSTFYSQINCHVYGLLTQHV